MNLAPIIGRLHFTRKGFRHSLRASSGETAVTCSSAEGATAPETLRQKNRDTLHLESDV